MTIRPDLVPGKYYRLDDFPEYGIVMFTNDYYIEGKDGNAPMRFVKGEIVRIYCAKDVKVTEVKDECIR